MSDTVPPSLSKPPATGTELALGRRFAFAVPFARIFHVARQSVRASVRSRFAASIAALVALVVLALPVLIPGDGSPEGDMRILLAWAPGLATILLGAASLWAGCGALATEIEEGTWPGLSSTRASRLQLWLGKWLGLVALDTVLLAAVLGLCAAQARFRGLPAARLRPYAAVAPEERAFRAQALVAAQNMLAAAPADAAATPHSPTNVAELAESLLAELREGPMAFPSGGSFTWVFPVDGGRGLRRGEPARLQLEVVSPYGTAAQMNGRLAVYAEPTPGSAGFQPADLPRAENAEKGSSGIRGESVRDADAPLAERTIVPEDNREVVLEVPGERLVGVDAVRVEFRNTGDEKSPAALIEVEEGVRFLVPRGSFFGNLARVWAVQLALLALLAAIGTAGGAMFTRPVAVFAATAAAVLGLVSHAGFDEEPTHVHDHGDRPAASAAAQAREHASRYILSRIADTTRPIADASALDRLGDSELVAGKPVFEAVCLDGVALPFLLGVFSVLVLRRREP